MAAKKSGGLGRGLDALLKILSLRRRCRLLMSRKKMPENLVSRCD